MTAFLIVLAILVVIFAFILSIRATFFITYDNGWSTRVKVLFFEKDIKLSELLSFVLFPKETAEAAADNKKSKKQKQVNETEEKNEKSVETEKSVEKSTATELTGEETGTGSHRNSSESNNETTQQTSDKKEKPTKQKPNFIKEIYDKDGICGIMGLVSTLYYTVVSAMTTLIKDFYISQLYVKIITGGSDAAEIAKNHGRVCSFYYPFIGAVRNGMKVKNYEEEIYADFLAPYTETGLDLVISLSVKNLLGIVLSAGKTFLVNFIKNK